MNIIERKVQPQQFAFYVKATGEILFARVGYSRTYLEPEDRETGAEMEIYSSDSVDGLLKRLNEGFNYDFVVCRYTIQELGIVALQTEMAVKNAIPDFELAKKVFA